MSAKLPRKPSDSGVRNRFRGCLLGGAVGDALGAPVEFMSAEEICEQFGEAGIRDLAPAFGRVGAITDDTQMTLFTAEGLMRGFMREQLKGICHPPSVIANAYLRWLHTQGEWHPSHGDNIDGWLVTNRELFARRAPGNTCVSALRSVKSFGDIAVNNSKGCGGVMRVAPVGMLFATLSPSGLRESMRTCFDLACKAAATTHGHATGQLASGAMALIVMNLLLDRPLLECMRIAATFLVEQPGHEETLDAMQHAHWLADSKRLAVAP